MDRIKRAKKVQRTKVTKYCNELQALLQVDPPDHRALRNTREKLEGEFERLAEADAELEGLMLDDPDFPEDELLAETEVNDSYHRKFIDVKNDVELILHPIVVVRPPSPAASGSSYSTARGGVKKTYKLPKIQIKKFGGELTEWLGWWAQFKKIHEDPDLHKVDKFQYLVQSMVQGSVAQCLVSRYLQSEENYPLVIAALEERFGNKDLLIEVYTRDLSRFVISNANKDKKLSEISDQLETKLNALEVLKGAGEENTVALHPFVESILPEEILSAWLRSPLSEEDGSNLVPPKSRLKYLREFLQKEVKNESRRALINQPTVSEDKPKSKSEVHVNTVKKQHAKSESATAAGLYVGSSNCFFCEKSHPSQDCGFAQTLTLEEKKDKLKEKKACFKCLKLGIHKPCKGFLKCAVCQGAHCVIMCPELPIHKSSTSTAPPQEPKTVSIVQLNCSNQILLQTILVRLVGPGGKEHVARLLFDSGAQRSYVKSSTAKFLKCESAGEEIQRKVLFGGQISEPKAHKIYRITIKSLDRKVMKTILALEEPSICGHVPRVPKGPWIQELAQMNVQLSDFDSSSPEIEILIGSDYWPSFFGNEIAELSEGLKAYSTVFGWTLMGVLPKEDSAAFVVTNALLAASETIQDMWSMEALGIRDPIEVKSQKERDEEVKEKFFKTITRNEEGRYSVGLPWTNEDREVPNNKNAAHQRLINATNKLHSMGKYTEYERIFKDWEEEGIIEEVHVDLPVDLHVDLPVDLHVDKRRSSHYLPHRPVFKESKTTPIRPVFDASNKTGRSPSLNDCLEKGPNLLEKIPAILLRFREKDIGVVADIRKAFLMVEINEEDRDFLRFLWWECMGSKKLKILRHKRVVFGLNCGPFLLGIVIEYHLRNVVEEDKPLARKLLQSLYVDNCVTSVDTLAEYHHFKSKSTAIMAEAKMELRQWECNSGWETGIGPHSVGCGLGSSRVDTPVTSVLGLKWNKEEDTLSVDICPREPTITLTKRTLLSCVQSVFDPIGFLAPALLEPKIILQELWARDQVKKKEGKKKDDKKGIWDTEIPEEYQKRFLQWQEEMKFLSDVKIPRKMTSPESSSEYWQIHVFSDGSKYAYSAVVFLRDARGPEVSVQLLSAKARVAPMKGCTIPRLELMGCLIASRLAKEVKDALEIDIPTYYWSDSTTALSWIKRNDDWGTFVGNRVRSIISLTDANSWRHIPGIHNPADLPSRGCGPRALLESQWWEGPDWLRKPFEEWPGEEMAVDEEEVLAERKKSSLVMISVNDDEEQEPHVPHFSSYIKNVRVQGWTHRFINNSKLKKKEERQTSRFLTIQELRAAEKTLIKIVQREMKGYEKKVRTTLDEEGIVHVHTKIINRTDHLGFRSPILLPNKHPLVEQLIREIHIVHGHIGTQALLGALREKYWIIHSRKTVKAIIDQCTTCRRYNAKEVHVDSSALPTKRVNNCEPFQITGVDLAGPLTLRDNTKVWIVLYTCAYYRCVVLDLVDSLSTEAFIRCLQRFVNTNGRPNTIYSDNGTNFVGAVNIFKRLDWSRIERYSQIRQIQWIFNPPTAAWWGGWWERLVRSVKDLLRRMLGNAKLDGDEMRTSLTAAQAAINNRPLTTVTEDQDDLVELTPAMFLRNTASYDFPEAQEIGPRALQQNYRRVQTLNKQLQMRFRSEYLAQLVQRGHEKNSYALKVGDIVLVGADNKKRLEWPLAKILELIPGKDGKIRVAKIKTTNGTLTRPLQRLYPLEVSSPQEMEPIPPQVKKTAVARKPKSQEKSPRVESPPRAPVITRSGRQVKTPSKFVP